MATLSGYARRLTSSSGSDTGYARMPYHLSEPSPVAMSTAVLSRQRFWRAFSSQSYEILLPCRTVFVGLLRKRYPFPGSEMGNLTLSHVKVVGIAEFSTG